MDSLQQEILTIIETCHSAIAVPKKARPRIDTQTIGVARKILARLRDYDLNDDTLPTIKLNEGQLSWWELLAAMHGAQSFLESRRGRKRS